MSSFMSLLLLEICLFSVLFTADSVVVVSFSWSHFAFLSAPGIYSAWSGLLVRLKQQ